MTPLKAAVVQMCSSDCVEHNLEQIINGLSEAASQQAKIVALPENCLGFGVEPLRPFAESDALKQAISCIQQFAEQQAIHVLIGSVPVALPGSDKVYAQSQWVADSGKVMGQYNKMHLFDIETKEDGYVYRESDTFLQGSDPIKVEFCNDLVPFEAILSICYDVRFPEYYRRLMTKNTRLLMVPAAFTFLTGRAHWEILLRARAIENQLFVVAPNQSGLHHNGRRTWGHSMIVSPWGEILCEVEKEGFGVATAYLDFKEQDSVKARMPCLDHRRY